MIRNESVFHLFPGRLLRRPGRLRSSTCSPGSPGRKGSSPPPGGARGARRARISRPGGPTRYGLPELREEIAAYLRRSRGLAVRPEHVLVTQGVSSGLALLADALLTPGDKAGIEEPGYPAGREVLHRAGARVVPCRVDAHGIVPEELPGDLRLLYTTPAHQYPLGGRLPVSRRQALIAWAAATGAIIVEDDYDSEFRYDVGPLPALHSMDPDVIVYLGTASKVLATAFGAGWLVAPPELVDQLAALRARLGVRIPEPVQHAVLALLRSGDLERHVRKMRLEYARRRAALVDGLTQAGRDLAGAGHRPVPFRLLGDTAGLHVVLELPDEFPVGALIDAAAERGVAVYPLNRYFAGQPTMNGLILGYGTATLAQVRRAAAELALLLTRRLSEIHGETVAIATETPCIFSIFRRPPCCAGGGASGHRQSRPCARLPPRSPRARSGALRVLPGAPAGTAGASCPSRRRSGELACAR